MYSNVSANSCFTPFPQFQDNCTAPETNPNKLLTKCKYRTVSANDNKHYKVLGEIPAQNPPSSFKVEKTSAMVLIIIYLFTFRIMNETSGHSEKHLRILYFSFQYFDWK